MNIQIVRKTMESLHSKDCWWSNDSINDILQFGVDESWLTRTSNTEVKWTKKGVNALKFHMFQDVPLEIITASSWFQQATKGHPSEWAMFMLHEADEIIEHYGATNLFPDTEIRKAISSQDDYEDLSDVDGQTLEDAHQLLFSLIKGLLSVAEKFDHDQSQKHL